MYGGVFLFLGNPVAGSEPIINYNFQYVKCKCKIA